jgi:excisionase family DNA binding protein
MVRTTKSIHQQEIVANGAPQTLTPDEAAELLNVDRAYLLTLLDAKEILATGKGTQRRIRRDHILAYKAKRDTERRAALRELTKLSEDAGLYDADYRSITDPT